MKIQLILFISCIFGRTEQFKYNPIKPVSSSASDWPPKPVWESLSEWEPVSDWPQVHGWEDLDSVLASEPELAPDLVWQPDPEWTPRPESQCHDIPKASDVELTPIIATEVIYDTKLSCDPSSVVKKILYQRIVSGVRLTCNGVVVDKSDDYYDAVFDGYGVKPSEKLNLKNYTTIYTFNNGNVNIVECGTIVGGKCSDDRFFGTGLFVANKQKGCAKYGNNGLIGFARYIQIKGKCKSDCKLGSSSWAFAEPVNNHGLTGRESVDFDIDDDLE